MPLFRSYLKVNALFYTKRLILGPYNKVGKPYLALLSCQVTKFKYSTD